MMSQDGEQHAASEHVQKSVAEQDAENMEDEEDLISAAYNELPPEDGQDAEMGIEMQTYGSPDKQHPNDYAEEVELN